MYNKNKIEEYANYLLSSILSFKIEFFVAILLLQMQIRYLETKRQKNKERAKTRKVNKQRF